MPSITLHVSGMHCKACVALVESDVLDASGVTNAKASFKHHHITIEGEITEKPLEEIISLLDPFLVKHGYHLSVERKKHHIAWRDFLYAVPLALVFLAFFVLLQKLGIINLVKADNVNLPTTFFIGVIASLSTCMAVVGGLTLSVAANFAKGNDKTIAPLLFHLGRLVGFFVLGGVMGALGSTFEISQHSKNILNAVVAMVMLLLGINLLDITNFFKKWQPTLPRFISNHLLQINKLNHTLTPALIGAATFFLPCGFAQSMQLYALSTASFMDGALVMLVFALGTLPVLALLSFASAAIHTKKTSGVFFKTAGLVVIAFALFNLANVLTVSGVTLPAQLSSGNANIISSAVPSSNVRFENQQQFIEIFAKDGYQPSSTVAQSGMPAILKIKTDSTFDCSTDVVIPSLNYSARLPITGVTDVSLPAQEPNTTLKGVCGMGMYHFSITFVE